MRGSEFSRPLYRCREVFKIEEGELECSEGMGADETGNCSGGCEVSDRITNQRVLSDSENSLSDNYPLI